MSEIRKFYVSEGMLVI